MFLVGDAAGHVKVTTVGGVVTGLRGAAGVVREILGSRSGNHLRALRKELNLHLLVRSALHRFNQDDYVRLIDMLNEPAIKALSEYSRDSASQVLWRLCLAQPRLLLLGSRSLITGTFPRRASNS